jgi:hypothetical protein
MAAAGWRPGAGSRLLGGGSVRRGACQFCRAPARAPTGPCTPAAHPLPARRHRRGPGARLAGRCSADQLPGSEEEAKERGGCGACRRRQRVLDGARVRRSSRAAPLLAARRVRCVRLPARCRRGRGLPCPHSRAARPGRGQAAASGWVGWGWGWASLGRGRGGRWPSSPQPPDPALAERRGRPGLSGCGGARSARPLQRCARDRPLQRCARDTASSAPMQPVHARPPFYPPSPAPSPPPPAPPPGPAPQGPRPGGAARVGRAPIELQTLNPQRPAIAGQHRDFDGRRATRCRTTRAAGPAPYDLCGSHPQFTPVSALDPAPCGSKRAGPRGPRACAAAPRREATPSAAQRSVTRSIGRTRPPSSRWGHWRGASRGRGLANSSFQAAARRMATAGPPPITMPAPAAPLPPRRPARRRPRATRSRACRARCATRARCCRRRAAPCTCSASPTCLPSRATRCAERAAGGGGCLRRALPTGREHAARGAWPSLQPAPAPPPPSAPPPPHTHRSSSSSAR